MSMSSYIGGILLWLATTIERLLRGMRRSNNMAVSGEQQEEKEK